MGNISFVLVFVLTLFLNKNSASKCKFTNILCESFNKSWVTFEQCRLRAINRYKTIMNVNATLYHPAEKIDLAFKVLKKANGYKPFLMDSSIDACSFMKKRNHPFVKILYDFVKNYSSITHKCPYMGPQWVKDFHVVGEHVVLPLPTGEYALFLTWIFSGKAIFQTNVYFTFEEDLIKQ